MRTFPVAGLSLVIGMAFIANAVAADKKRPEPVAAPTAPSLLSEFRLGFSAQDPWGPEAGSANVVGEILFAKPLTPADLFMSYFVPRPHIGGSLNPAGRTSFAYTGLTWTIDITSSIFVEGTFGAAIHNGPTRGFIPPDRQALGCSPLFRESGSVGVKLSATLSLMATVEHLSNGGACSDNRGLTNVGARVGYSF